MNHQRQPDDGYAGPLSHDRRLSEFDLVRMVGNGALQRHQFAVLQKENRIVAAQRTLKKPLGIVWRCRDDHAQTRNMSVD